MDQSCVVIRKHTDVKERCVHCGQIIHHRTLNYRLFAIMILLAMLPIFSYVFDFWNAFIAWFKFTLTVGLPMSFGCFLLYLMGDKKNCSAKENIEFRNILMGIAGGITLLMSESTAILGFLSWLHN